MSDPRPAPQYGEYATPEQQRAAMGLPANPEVVGPAAEIPVAQATSAAPQPSASVVAAEEPRRVPFWDRAITVGLLAYGAVNLLATVPQLVDFRVFAGTWMDTIGIEGEFTNYAAGIAWGVAAAIAYTVGFVLTVLWAWRRMAARRIAFWVPVVGAVVTFVVMTACLLPPLLGDPAVISHFLSAGR